MNNQLDVEKIIQFLKEEKGISQTEMMEKVGVERGGFLSWRRSTNKGRRNELAKKLKEAYPEYFEKEGDVPNQAEGTGIELKYITYLEKEIERLRMENEKLMMWLQSKIETTS